MRWKAEDYPWNGALRTRWKFLLWPRRSGGEWRWLEWAYVEERYRRGYDGDQWEFNRFVDEGGEG